MNLADLLLGFIVLFSVFNGYQQGFIKAFSGLIVWVGSILLGLLFFDKAVGLLARWFPKLGYATALFALLVPILLFQVLLSIGANAFFRQVHPDTHRSTPNKLLGIFPGLANGWITVAIIAAVLSALPTGKGVQDALQKSPVAQALHKQAAWFEDRLPKGIKDGLSNATLKVPATQNEVSEVKLPFKVTDASPRPELEAQMLVLINKERQKRNLKPLEWDDELLPVARAHSRDMFASGYFAHENKSGLSPSQRIKKAKVPFRTAGENLALGPTLDRCHTGLMNSPGHRANILNPDYGSVGIGILDGGIHGLMITQNFRN